MSANDGGRIWRACDSFSVNGWFHGSPGSLLRFPACPRCRPVGSLAAYLGVGTGVLVAEWHVVQPDGSLLPALSWNTEDGAA